jgi:ketosteroid isomerase-like protein
MSRNVDNTKKAYAAFASGDIATVSELIAADCIWHVGGRSQLTGDYVGQEQILGYFAKLFELTDGTFSVRLDDIGETEAGLVTCVVTLTGTRNGKTLTTRMVETGRSNAAGQLAEAWWYAEDGYAADEFFGPAQIVLPDQTKVATNA